MQKIIWEGGREEKGKERKGGREKGKEREGGGEEGGEGEREGGLVSNRARELERQHIGN